MTKLPAMGVAGPFALEDSKITMGDIFKEIHLEEQHPILIPPISGREEAEPEVTIAKGVASDLGQEEGLSVEHFTTPTAIGPPYAPRSISY